MYISYIDVYSKSQNRVQICRIREYKYDCDFLILLLRENRVNLNVNVDIIQFDRCGQTI